MTTRIFLPLFIFITCVTFGAAADAIPPIRRVLPPEGLEIPADVRTRLETRLAETKKRLEFVKEDPNSDEGSLRVDIEIFTKAVELALAQREFYVENDFSKADWALDEANKRLDSIGEAPWTKATGLVVRGYRSRIDGSVQPYGLVIPKDHDFHGSCPLYVWLHGRGDKNTDLHFLQERATRAGQITPPNAIVVHPFGRHCVGWKHAGEVDAIDAAFDVVRRYGVSMERMVLIGFSMGGAGAWHIGAHHTNCWLAVAPGAGFAETARYQRLTPDRYPPWYEQKLWGLYDVPDYVRKLFNTEVIAYSGELDRQIQAAHVMEEAYKAEGRSLTHLIGPGVEHRYEPKTLEELLRRLSLVAPVPRESRRSVHVQTKTMRYPFMSWVQIRGLQEHWKDSRVDAEIVGPKQIQLMTKNISALALDPFSQMLGTKITIDGQEVVVGSGEGAPQHAFLAREGDVWKHKPADWRGEQSRLAKRYRLQGPIDDAFMEKFLVVVPTGKSKNEQFQTWVDFELNHFRDRWRALMRGELPMKRDVDMQPQDFSQNLVLWGDADSNAVMAKLLKELPVGFADRKWQVGNQAYDGDRFVPVFIFPRKSDRGEYWSYLVFNSGLTFREGHDRTNSLQNPKLPDWAIIDITQPPDAFAPGRIHDAGFFDEEWKLKSQPKAP